MLNKKDFLDGICHVCKKKLDISADSPNMDDFVYISFTGKKMKRKGELRFIYFCPPCWLLTSSEEFYPEDW